MNSKLFLLFFCASVISWKCAAFAPPTGGKKDTTPPELLSASPPSGTVRLLEQVVELTFSEYMDEKSFTTGIRIAPVLEVDPVVKFKGNRVRVIFPDGVKNDMTVVLTLSRAIKDEHGVELAKPIQLAYSTGDEIDTGIIKGRVYSSIPAAVYLFNDDESDTLLLSKPNYICETEDNGSFEFNYLSPGKYKILALERSAAGLQLDQKRLSYGVPFINGVKLDSIFTGIRIRLFKEKEPLRLLRGEWKNWNWGQLYFNNNIVDSVTIDGLQIGDQDMKWFNHPDDENVIVVTVTDTIQTEKEQISFKHISLNQTILAESSAVNVFIPAEVDTNYLTVVSPAAKKTITPDQMGPPIELVFSRPLTDSLLNNMHVELMIDDTNNVAFKQTIQSPMKISIIPQDGWKPKKSYQMKLFRHDSSNEKNTFKDSVSIINIETTRSQGYGGFTGSIEGYESAQLITEISSVEKAEWNFNSVVNSEGRFEFKHIPESSYIFHVFEDVDNDKTFSNGKAYPYQPSEWFYELPDTIEIRANWDIEFQSFNVEK